MDKEQKTEILRNYWKKGYNFFHIQTTEKKVMYKWHHLQHERVTIEQIKRWLTLPYQNWAIVCGEISNLTVIDVDPRNGGDPAMFQNRGTYEVRTPSGGWHFYFKYNTAFEKSTKFTAEDTSQFRGIDIQSNGKLVFAPPTRFANGGYEIVNDSDPIEMPEDILIAITEARLKQPESAPQLDTDAREYKRPAVKDMKPGDVFNALASWEEILYPRGWRKFGHVTGDGNQFWTRPGKHHGISASTKIVGDAEIFYCFSSQAGDILPDHGYTKFSLLAQLEYNGDYARCAKDLVMRNYKTVVENNSMYGQ